MSKLDLSNLDTIIENLKISKESVKSILEEQDLTLFHTKDYYEGELNVYRDVILMLELYQEHQKNRELEEAIKICKNLSKYLQLKIDSGEHKIFYNNLMYNEKTIDCINAIETLVEAVENSIPTSVVREKIQAYSKNCTVINSFIVDVLQELLQEKRREIMLKIKDSVDLKELEKFRFWRDKNFTSYHRGIYEDCIKQYEKKEYLLILKNKVIVKGKLECILDFNGNVVNGYKILTNRVSKYIQDLIQAGLVEKVSDTHD